MKIIQGDQSAYAAVQVSPFLHKKSIVCVYVIDFC